VDVDDLEWWTRSYRRRNPWLAGLLSFVTPGLGQVYNGQLTRGLQIYGVLWGIGLAAFAILLGRPVAPWHIAILALMVISWLLYGVVDAILTARRQGTTYRLKAYNKWYLYLLITAIALAIPKVVDVLIIRGFT